MAALNSAEKTPITTKPERGWIVFGRYALTRFITIAITVVIAVYITILVANLGGYVDEIIRGRVAGQIMGMVQGGWLAELSPEERTPIIEETTLALEAAEGLNTPFLLRTLWWLGDGLTLGFNQQSTFRRPGSSAPAETRELIAESLSRTLMIFGVSNILLFTASIFLALILLRIKNRWLDRLLLFLSPLSGAPAWVYGVILTAVFINFGFSTGGVLDGSNSEFSLAYIRNILRALTLPLIAIFISGLLQSIYAWRAFFLVYSEEQYVELGKAKGLKPSTLERRYVLRPAMPALITSLALLIMTLWQEVIALEYFFNIEGIGFLLITAINRFSTPIVVGLVVTFAYLLGITVFVLDIIYAFVDPRIRVGKDSSPSGPAAAGASRRLRLPKLPSPTGIVYGLQRTVHQWSLSIRSVWQDLRQSKSALLGLGYILFLIVLSIGTVIALPVDTAIEQWRGSTGEFARNPRSAEPVWMNWLRREKLPESLAFVGGEGDSVETRERLSDDVEDILFTFPIAYDSVGFPQDLVVDLSAEFEEKAPHIIITLITPDNREIELSSFASTQTQAYFASVDERLMRRLDTEFPQRTLFAAEGDTAAEQALPGDYTLQVSALTFEPESDVSAEVTLIGQVYGIAGTDESRRDLTVALLWGTPVALAFGLGAAVATSVFSLAIAAIGAWFGGWVDRSIQFLTEVNLILPFYPVALLVFMLYSKSIWAILGVTVLLSLFGDSIKTYRAAFLQIKQASYVDAAQAYGASGWRIALQYLMPRMTGVMLPRLILLVPSYVFLEATLAFLGVSDPSLPTWGKLIVAALSSSIYGGVSHIVLFPLAVLFMTALAFALVARALERTLQPNLYD